MVPTKCWPPPGRAQFLIDLDAELVDNRFPERDISFETLPEFFRTGITADLEPRFDQPLLILLVGERRACRLGDLLRDRLRGLGRRCNADGPHVRDPRKALLGRGRD